MLNILSRIPDGDIYIITKSPPEQYSNSQIKIKESGEENKSPNEYESAFTVLDDILGSSNCKYIHQFFNRGKHINLDIYYLAQPYLDLPKRTIRNNNNKIILYNQTWKDIETLYRDVGGYDMSYDEFKQLCRSWEEKKNIYVLIDLKRDQGRYCTCDKSENTYIEFTPETKAFWLTWECKNTLWLFSESINSVFIQKQRRFRKFKWVSLVTQSSKSFWITR